MSPVAEWRIRPARPSDRPFILGLLPRLADDFDLPPWRTADEVVRAEAATIERALAGGHDTGPLLVAESAGEVPAGFVYLERHLDYFRGVPHGHVAILAVAEEAEGQGVGRALMMAAEEWSRGEGMRMLTLNVFDRNVRARGVYERLGFTPETLRYAKPL